MKQKKMAMAVNQKRAMTIPNQSINSHNNFLMITGEVQTNLQG